ncbi:MAG: hypothetical protein ACTH2I_12710 [Staphylococcus equorum]|uniref:hypothetical protein n=1 Tax=Mammaliicoccus vitulinus TaxID=71237 RepID=UPI000E6773E4|nr:hypothetical protein [Mammaliicoccus vitulinus]RIN24107.1 hypothetical protein BU070_04615 [Mammaliicoccus vitulinus]
MKKSFKFLITIFTAVLIFSVVTNSPANAQQETPTKEESKKAKQFTKESLTINDDGTYSIDKNSALKIYSEKEVQNIENTFNSLDKQTLASLKSQYGSSQDEQQDVTLEFAPAVPIVAMGIWDLLAWLGTIGASTLAAAFAKDMYNHGVKSACKKHAHKNKHLKSWCTSNGYL